MDNLGWHFVGNKLRDGRPIPEDGVKLVHNRKLVMCESGLHLSRRLVDALTYAPGNTICRVEFDGDFLEDSDKIVASERTILWRIDGEKVLRDFARKCALGVIHLWDAPEIVKNYLETGDENLRDATRASVCNRGRDSAWDSVSTTARAAARAAARSATWDAARAAAWNAAMASAKFAVEVRTLHRAESTYLNTLLTEMVEAEHNR